jgi:TRAP-type C4-dicarboxylate transport system substrate-binding protein
MKTHTRRRIVAVAAALAACAGHAAAAEITWKTSIWGERRSSSEPIEWYAKEVAARTGGRMKIEVAYDRNAKPTAAPDQLKSGASGGAYFCSSYYGDKMPLTSVLDLPMFAPESIPVLSRVELALADHPAIQEELRKWNVKMLVPAPLPQYQLMGTRRIARIEDLRGARVRIPAEIGKIFSEYGATTLLVGGNEAAAALKSGALDAYSTAYPVSFAAQRAHEVSKYVTDNISLGTQLCYFGVSRKAWDALPAAIQQVMQGLRPLAVAKYAEIYAREDASTIELFKKQGLEFVSFNATDRARLVARSIKVWQAWVEDREKQGLRGREVFEFTQAKIRQYSGK